MSCVESSNILIRPKLCIDFDIDGSYEFVRLIIINDSSSNPTFYSRTLYPPLPELSINITDLYPTPRSPYYGNHYIRVEYYGKDNDNNIYLMHYEDRVVYLMPLEVTYINNQCEEKIFIKFTYQFSNCDSGVNFIHYIEDEDGNYIPNTHNCSYDINTNILECEIVINTDEFSFSQLNLDSVISCGSNKVQFSNSFDVCAIDFDYSMVYLPSINTTRVFYTFKNCLENDGFIIININQNSYRIEYTDGFVSGYIDLQNEVPYSITYSPNDQCFCVLEPQKYEIIVFQTDSETLRICDKLFCIYINSESLEIPSYDPFYGFYKIKILDNNDNTVFTSSPISNINGNTNLYCFNFSSASLVPGEFYKIIVLATNDVLEIELTEYDFLWHEINFSVLVSTSDTTIEVNVNPNSLNILEYNITVYNIDNTIFFETNNIDAPNTFIFIVNSIFSGSTARIRYTYKFEDELGQHTYTCEKVVEVESESDKILFMFGIGAYIRAKDDIGNYETHNGTFLFYFHPFNQIDLNNNIIDADCDYLETNYVLLDSLDIVGFSDFDINYTVYQNFSTEQFPVKLNSWAGTRQVIGSFTCPSDSSIINFNFNNIKIPFCNVNRNIRSDSLEDYYVDITVTYKGIAYNLLIDSINNYTTNNIYSNIKYMGILLLGYYTHNFMYTNIIVDHSNQEVVIQESFLIIPFHFFGKIDCSFIGYVLYSDISQFILLGSDGKFSLYTEEFSASDLMTMYPYMFDYCNVSIDVSGDAIFTVKLRKRHSFIHKIKLSFAHSNGVYSQTIDIRSIPSNVDTFYITVTNAASIYAGETINYVIELYFTVPNSINVINPDPPVGTDILLRDVYSDNYTFP